MDFLCTFLFFKPNFVGFWVDTYCFKGMQHHVPGGPGFPPHQQGPPMQGPPPGQGGPPPRGPPPPGQMGGKFCTVSVVDTDPLLWSFFKSALPISLHVLNHAFNFCQNSLSSA